MPDHCVACSECEYHKKSLEQAAILLKTVIRQAHLRSVDGKTLMEAVLDPGVVLKMCIWESDCEDCENGEAMGDGPEPWDGGG